jgi:hypothetical protein
MKLKFATFVISAFVFFSCEQLFMEPSPGTKPQNIFEQVWKFTNDKYTFFEYKKIDWNLIKSKYESQIFDSMPEEDLFRVCSDMLYELKDEHVNLVSDFNISRNPEVFLDFPTNYDSEILNRYYFKGRLQYLDGGNFRLFDFGDVLYVNYSSFINQVKEESMDYICEKANAKKGMILDLRQNGGGSVGNINAIAGRFVDNKIFTGFEYNKTGPKKTDLRQDSLNLKPYKADTIIHKYTNKPIIVLTNRGCYSATNFFAMMVKEIPNVTVLGGKTGGGGGVPSTTALSNGWTLRVSSSVTLDKNGLNIEGGVEPDIRVDISASDKSQNKDTILDEALKILRR